MLYEVITRIHRRQARIGCRGKNAPATASRSGRNPDHSQRRLFEESVTRLAKALSSYLDGEEEAAQAMYPRNNFV